MTSRSLLTVHGLTVETVGGRPLIQELRATLENGERAAILGRNGVGKSTLLRVLAGEDTAARGRVLCHGSRRLVPQDIGHLVHGAESPGQARRTLLEEARLSAPDLLLLDEPTQDLDAQSIDWLLGWLSSFQGALLVVSHDERLLRGFSDFLLIAESGCQHRSGDFQALLAEMNRESERKERVFLSQLQRQQDLEAHQDVVRRRRARKKNLGRLHELKRCTSRARLNEKRSYAQESQGKRSVLQAARIEAARRWARSARRALTVELDLPLLIPKAAGHSSPAISLHDVAAVRDGRTLFENLNLSVHRERIAITGANGSGKSTLVAVLAGERTPSTGRARCDASRIGYIAQGSRNWTLDESCSELLRVQGAADTEDDVSRLFKTHKFPLALGERPLASLSPGERLRAALICLCHRGAVPDVLILDEPTQHLDFVGNAALRAVLAAYRGGLVLVSHDESLLSALDMTHHIAFHGALALESVPKATTFSSQDVAL